MEKAILIIDMPGSCKDCRFPDPGGDVCLLLNKDISENEFSVERPNWCPLKIVPKRAYHENYCDSGRYDMGYNACIDEILKE